MRRELEIATEAPAELESQARAESTPESLNALELSNANDVALQRSMPGWRLPGKFLELYVGERLRRR